MEIEGLIDSHELYQKLIEYKINMLDLGNKTVIQGEVTEYSFLRVVIICKRYGTLSITIN